MHVDWTFGEVCKTDFTEVLCDSSYNLWNTSASALWGWLCSIWLSLNFLYILLFPEMLCQWYSCRGFISLLVLESKILSSFALHFLFCFKFLLLGHKSITDFNMRHNAEANDCSKADNKIFLFLIEYHADLFIAIIELQLIRKMSLMRGIARKWVMRHLTMES